MSETSEQRPLLQLATSHELTRYLSSFIACNALVVSATTATTTTNIVIHFKSGKSINKDDANYVIFRYGLFLCQTAPTKRPVSETRGERVGRENTACPARQ